MRSTIGRGSPFGPIRQTDNDFVSRHASLGDRRNIQLDRESRVVVTASARSLPASRVGITSRVVCQALSCVAGQGVGQGGTVALIGT